MYSYLYDVFLRDRRYEALVNRIEARISELGLQGKVEKLTILKNAKEIVEDAVKKNVDTFVVVGDDSTISKILNSVAGKNITLGIIPVGPKQIISTMLGIPYGDAACETLSRRIVRKLDLGRANAQHFLLSLEVPQSSVSLECDRGFAISALGAEDKILVSNLASESMLAGAVHARPDDGYLEAIISPAARHGFFGMGKTARRPSVFPMQKLKIVCKNECIPVLADGENVVKTPVNVDVLPQSLRVIVGRDRTF
jgi:diacylglycerol kinase family enzyme